MKQGLTIGVLVALGVAIYFAVTSGNKEPEVVENSIEINEASEDVTFYTCGEDRSLSVTYGDASAVVVLDSGERMELARTDTDEGVRYVNEDESLAFWVQDDSAIVMRDNVMDLEYSDCRVLAE